MRYIRCNVMAFRIHKIKHFFLEISILEVNYLLISRNSPVSHAHIYACRN